MSEPTTEELIKLVKVIWAQSKPVASNVLTLTIDHLQQQTNEITELKKKLNPPSLYARCKQYEQQFDNQTNEITELKAKLMVAVDDLKHIRGGVGNPFSGFHSDFELKYFISNTLAKIEANE